MATQAQIAANRLNARKSTGPRSPEGKAKVAQNALKHGLRARQAVIRGEDADEFEAFRAEMLDDLAPVGALESMLAGRVVGLSWRLLRAERFQNDAFDFRYLAETAQPSIGLGQIRYTAEKEGVQDDVIAGKVIVRDFGNLQIFERLLMYEKRIEQSLYRAMAELERVRRLRQSRPPAETVEEPARQTKPIDVPESGSSPVGVEDEEHDGEANGETYPIAGVRPTCTAFHISREDLPASRQTVKQSQWAGVAP